MMPSALRSSAGMKILRDRLPEETSESSGSSSMAFSGRSEWRGRRRCRRRGRSRRGTGSFWAPRTHTGRSVGFVPSRARARARSLVPLPPSRRLQLAACLLRSLHQIVLPCRSTLLPERRPCSGQALYAALCRSALASALLLVGRIHLAPRRTQHPRRARPSLQPSRRRARPPLPLRGNRPPPASSFLLASPGHLTTVVVSS
jgi:hypothetical protein